MAESKANAPTPDFPAMVARIDDVRMSPPPQPLSKPQPPSHPTPDAKPVMRPVSSFVRSSARLVVCCWPIGEPGTPDFHFCDGEALSGKPYCAAHAQVAYVKVRDRREEAA
jgi:GcrA cell cycle regulator